ncbi:MAG: PKD domain-containing protein [Anaerolineales bacterium]|nr:PKD domain-containing protein [Anaerolineales bacterium]
MTGKKIFQSIIVLLLLLGAPVATFAQDGLSITVTTSVSCDQVDFLIEFQGDLAPNTVTLTFGDSESFLYTEPASETIMMNHSYPSQGEYEWTLTVTDDDGLVIIAEADGIVTIDGPTVSLGSVPTPPLLTIDGGEASIDFTTLVTGGEEPYFYSWDLDGDNLPDAGLSGSAASYTYTSGGNYTAAVTVSDSGTCGLTHTDTLTVVVVDPEADPQDACHPTAQKIAEAVSIIFLDDRAEQTYTCEDIFNIFEGALLGNHIGFGRLWHAYQLTQTIPDLTWEEIRDWKLDGSSWGAITQLNRFADTLDEYGIRDLFDLVVNGDNTVGEIRTAARAAVRYEADLTDALLRLSEGAKAGELGQFYKLAQDLEMDPAALDVYLDGGASLSELRHSAKLAERTGGTLDAILEAKSNDHSWGDISQAYRMADEGMTVDDILTQGVQEYREFLRNEEKLAREDERAALKAEQNDKTAARLSEQYGFTGDMNALFAECEGSWGCVRKKLKDMDQEAQVEGVSDKDTRTAERLSAQYGVPFDTVWAKYSGGECSGDWNCVRAELRDTHKNNK